MNNVAGHGIPDARELQEGDILNIDVTVFLDGFHGDCSATVPVGQVDDHALKLIQVGQSETDRLTCGEFVNVMNRSRSIYSGGLRSGREEGRA